MKISIMLKYFPFFLLWISQEVTGRQRQRLECYDRGRFGGNKVIITDYVEDLRDLGFDNRIKFCCFTGIWILYADRSFNSFNTRASNWWAYGENYCSVKKSLSKRSQNGLKCASCYGCNKDLPATFINKPTSVRFTGAPDDGMFDTINLYEYDFYVGREQYSYGDLPVINNLPRVRSVITTGCKEGCYLSILSYQNGSFSWTLFELPFYEGRSACIGPPDPTSCNPGFYGNLPPTLLPRIGSARRGCYDLASSLPADNQHEVKFPRGAALPQGRVPRDNFSPTSSSSASIHPLLNFLLSKPSPT